MKSKLLTLALLLALGSPALAETKVTPIKPLTLSVDHGINLTLSQPASSVFVANPEIADVQVMSPTSIMIFGKRSGETSFMASDSSGHTLEQRTVRVTQDLSDLRTELNVAIPGNKITASALPNGLVLMGTAKDNATVADAYKIAQRFIPAGGDIINRIKVEGSNQIQIRVRFAEVQKNLNNSFGIDWANAASIGGLVFGLANGATVNTALQGTSGSGGVNGLFPRPNNSTLNSPNDVLGFSHSGQRFNINGMIDALAQDGLVTILAEPTLTAMSGETANFLAGGEFPIPVPQGNNTISIEFKNYGVSLSFTPTLIGESRVSLHVKPEVSELSTTGELSIDNITVPGLLTRRAETTVEVASGQSFAIAGLLDNSQAQTINKFPLLGDMPVLGALFRSNQFQSGQTELVIIITPYIVTPNGEKQMALPTDGLAPPSEADRLFRLRYSASNPDARPTTGDPEAVRELPAPAATLPPGPTSMAAPVAAPVAAVTTTNVPVVAAAPAITPAAAPADVAMAPIGERPALIVTPMTPVSAPQPIQQPVALKTNISLSPTRVQPGHLSPEGGAPSGPGGFILE